METISSSQTFLMKRVVPALWFGLMVLVALSSARGMEAKDAPFLLVPLAAGVFGFLLMRKLVWDLADEVRDSGGDFLLVRRGDVEDRVALANVLEINTSLSTKPPRLKLRLRSGSKFGGEIAFIPRRGSLRNPFARDEMVARLNARVGRARDCGVRA